MADVFWLLSDLFGTSPKEERGGRGGDGVQRRPGGDGRRAPRVLGLGRCLPVPVSNPVSFFFFTRRVRDSAVLRPMFPAKYSFHSIFQVYKMYHTFAALQTQNISISFLHPPIVIHYMEAHKKHQMVGRKRKNIARRPGTSCP